MATNTKGYTFRVTNVAQQDAQQAFNARGAHDDWRINSEARVFQAKVRGEVVWAYRLMNDGPVTLYVTQEQAATFGLCHCGKAATVCGFEGLRCDSHQKGGMSWLCTTEDCTNVSETGFSSYCAAHTTPAMRAAREARQQELRAQATRSYRY